jgi:hypothetical protein
MESCRLIRVTSNEPVFTSIYDVKRKVWMLKPPHVKSGVTQTELYEQHIRTARNVASVDPAYVHVRNRT